MKRLYYEAEKDYLSFANRIKILGKVLCIAVAGTSQGILLIKTYIACCILSTSTDYTSVLCHAAFFGGCIGYCVREACYAYWGYKPRKYIELIALAKPTGLLPERASVHITEITPNLEATPVEGEVCDPIQDGQNQGQHAWNATKASPPGTKQQVDITPPLFRIIFSFFSRFTISIRDMLSGVHRSLSFKNVRSLAMLAYIGWKAKHAAMPTDEVMECFYQNHTKNSLDQDKTQIKKTVKSVLEELSGIESEDLDIELLKAATGKGSYNNLVLSEHCLLDIPPTMSFWYKTAREQHLKQVANTLTIADLREQYKEVIVKYGRGFCEENLCADQLQTDKMWDWAIPDFKRHRKAQLEFLSYCAQREKEESTSVNDPLLQAECLERAAKLYKTASLTCATFTPELQKGEDFLQQSLHTYMRLNKLDKAQKTCVQYKKRLQKYRVSWQPNKETRRLLG